MKSGKMTQAEADQQAAEMADVLGMVSGAGMPDAITRMIVGQMADEFVSVLTQSGYELSIGLLDTGNVAIGLVKSDEKETGPVAGGGYVMAEFSADGIRKMLGMGDL
ncbi:hypothetical protein SEA_RICKROSS_5 [Streptomyces phage RickRoss]|nr:hypothetical protein SEA_RICKROSS_5 [Streptomyces phage RickRoss]